MKRGTIIILLTLITAVFITVELASAQPAPIKPVKLKVSSAYPPPEVSMFGEIAKTWGEEVTKRTKGAITFEFYWGGALGAPAEHIELARKGTVQLAQTHEWYTPSRFPIGNFEYVFPFGPTDYVLVAKAVRKIREEFPQFAADETKNNVIMICDPPGGRYDFMSRKPLRTVDDFKGEKVSLIGRYFGQWLPPGAVGVVRPAAERYDMLRSGVVDVDLLPFDLFYAFKIDEVTKYYIRAHLTTACWGPLLMNLDTFKGFPTEVQKIFLETGKEMEMKTATEIIPRWWEKATKAWKARGIIFIDFPDKEREKWAATLSDIPAEWAAEVEGKGYPGFKIVQRWQQITSQMGFKWARKWGVKK
jgi:TRAP-type C4-dicarboxylate transport system substrate-binding protein